jgi:Domain of unknown function (DUF4185)
MAYSIVGSSLIQSSFSSEPDPQGNLEAVVYLEKESQLLHYWRLSNQPDAPWQRGLIISSQAKGPGCIIQSSFGSPHNFEVVVPEEGGLAHYWHNNSDLSSPWNRANDYAAPGSTGSAAMVQNRLNQNLEVVVLHGTELRHHWFENGTWNHGVVITNRATGPACMIQSSYNNNLELVVLEDSNLILYWRDSSEPHLPWKFGGIISSQATGPAGFVQGDFAEVQLHKNFEVVVPEGDKLSHYWRDNSSVAMHWKFGGHVTYQSGVVASVALTKSGLEGKLEVLSQEANKSIFHYYRYLTPTSIFQWYRSYCIRIDEGMFQADRSRPMSAKVVQLTGEIDKQIDDFAYNFTEQSFGIRGTDLGASFEHNGRTYFLFGDTHRTFQTGQALADAIAYTTTSDASSGLPLFFHLSYPKVVNPAIHQEEYDVPVDGFSFNGQMFVFFTTDHFRNRKVMGRSVLTRCLEPLADFESSRSDTPLKFQYLTEFSNLKFINVSVEPVNQDVILSHHLPGATKGLLIWGTGAYRADHVYLAFLPLDDEQQTSNLFGLRYFIGVQNGIPQWSTNEIDAIPLFIPAAIGELSVRWNSILKRWVLMYCNGPEDPIGGTVCLRVSRTPWGPWSQRWLVLDWIQDGLGYRENLGGRDKRGWFIHDGVYPEKEKEIFPPEGLGDNIIPRPGTGGGAAYAPYQLPRYTERSPAGATLYFLLSTWNPYQVVLMRHEINFNQLEWLAVWA